MSAKWEKKGTNDGELTFEIDLPKIQEGLDQAFQRVRKNLTVPGFRKGKVSRTVFKRMYGDAALYEDALNILLPDAYEAAVKESGIDPVDQPKIDVESMDEGKPWVIKANVTVKPEVKLGQYKGVEVPKQDVEVSDDDVNAELEKRREQQAELVVKDDKAAENGDTVVIDYVGTIDGKEFDGGSSKNYSLELGSNSFIPGFEEQLVGHKSGDEVTVNVTFPEDYKATDLAGKAAEFKTTIHEVKVKELPELDDDFAKDLDDDVDTLAELKDKIKKELTDQRKEAAKNAVQEAAIKFMEFVISKEGGHRMIAECGEISCVKGAWDETNCDEKQLEAINLILAATEPAVWQDCATEATIANAFMNGGQLLLTGDMTAEDVMASVQTAAAALK